MKVYIVFSGSCYPYSDGDILGVFKKLLDAENMINSCSGDDSFMVEHEVIE